MATLPGPITRPPMARLTLSPALVAITAALLAAGCASLGDQPTTTAALASTTAEPGGSEQAAKAPQTELEKAIEYWGKIYQKEPRNKKAGLSYAKNLKAAGSKQAAFEVLQQLAVLYANDREVASEYGRLALEFDQASLAANVLALADDPAQPDWRVISARGTAAAKLGRYAEAVPFFERAHALAPSNPSVLNNLAMAYAANGQADRAEALLRSALEQRPSDERIRQNLTIVLGLKGEHSKAREIAASGQDAESASANAALLQRMVKSAETAPAPVVTAATTAAQPKADAAKSRSTPKAVASAETAAGAMRPAATGFSDAEADALIRRAIAEASGAGAKAP